MARLGVCPGYFDSCHSDHPYDGQFVMSCPSLFYVLLRVFAVEDYALQRYINRLDKYKHKIYNEYRTNVRIAWGV